MEEARAAVERAKKELQKPFLSKKSKAENAAHHLERAGHMFKSRNRHSDAADCFKQAADLLYTTGDAQNRISAAGLTEAAGIQQRLDKNENAGELMDRAATMYVEIGKGRKAADLTHRLGEALEVNGEFQQAAARFRQAADLYAGEGEDNSALQCVEKAAVASAASEDPDLQEAARLFEQIGLAAQASRNNLRSPKHFFRAVLCIMASGDAIGARAKQDEFAQTNFRYGTTREGKFAAELVSAMESFSLAQFSSAYRGAYCLLHARVTRGRARAFDARRFSGDA